MKIEVGKTYLTLDGMEFTIKAQRGPDCYIDGMGNEWFEDGKFYSCYDGGNPFYDLESEA